MSYLLHFYIARQIYYPLSLLNGIIEGDFGSAFAGGWGVWFIVVYDAKFTFIYHFVIAFHVGGAAGADDMFRIVCILVAFQKVVLIMLTYIWIFCSYIDSFYVRVFFFYFGYEFKAQAIKSALAPEKKCIDLFLNN